jgi:ABC-type amino acid transport substrate-binding protein
MAVIHSPPFMILKNPTAIYSDMTDNYKKINITEFDGVFKDLLLYLQDRMGFIPFIMLANQTTQYDELVDGVANDLFDIVMSAMTITPKRNKMVDFSVAIIPRSIRIVIRKPQSIQLDSLFFLNHFHENSGYFY